MFVCLFLFFPFLFLCISANKRVNSYCDKKEQEKCIIFKADVYVTDVVFYCWRIISRWNNKWPGWIVEVQSSSWNNWTGRPVDVTDTVVSCWTCAGSWGLSLNYRFGLEVKVCPFSLGLTLKSRFDLEVEVCPCSGGLTLKSRFVLEVEVCPWDQGLTLKLSLKVSKGEGGGWSPLSWASDFIQPIANILGSSQELKMNYIFCIY